MATVAPNLTASPINNHRRTLRFLSGADYCEAWLYEPTPSADKSPVIVMAHGLGGIKEVGLPPFAERFCAAGYACLVFDYRYFGTSGGEPRELLDIPSQLEDWRAAVAFARSLPSIDPNRVIVWGTSFGGGHAIITAANDSRVAAAIVQCPFTDGPSSVLAIDWKTNLKLTIAALRDMAAKLLRREAVRVHTVGYPGDVALMTSVGSREGIYALLHASGVMDFRTYVPARIAFQIAFHRPGRWASKVKCPVLFVVCEYDSVAPAKATLRHAKKAPQGEIRLYSEGHFDIYLGESFVRNIGDQIAFLKRHVPLN